MTVANGLVVAQVVLSVVLLVCAGLFLRSFGRLTHVPLGFDRDRVLLADIDARRADLTPAARLAAYERIRQRVLRFRASTRGRLDRGAAQRRDVEPPRRRLRLAASEPRRPQTDPKVSGSPIEPFPRTSRSRCSTASRPAGSTTFGTRLLAGRDITEHDGLDAPRVALVNQAFARKFLGGANPVGHTVRPSREAGSPTIEIVGLLTDAVYRNMREPILPTVYVPLSQSSEETPPTAAGRCHVERARGLGDSRLSSRRASPRRSARSTRRSR